MCVVLPQNVKSSSALFYITTRPEFLFLHFVWWKSRHRLSCCGIKCCVSSIFMKKSVLFEISFYTRICFNRARYGGALGIQKDPFHQLVLLKPGLQIYSSKIYCNHWFFTIQIKKCIKIYFHRENYIDISFLTFSHQTIILSNAFKI